MSRRLPAGNEIVGHDKRDDPGRVLGGGALVGARGRVHLGALHGPADGVVVESGHMGAVARNLVHLARMRLSPFHES